MNRRRARLLVVLSAILIAAGAAMPAPAAAFSPSRVDLRLSLVASGLSKPVLLVGAGDGSGRRFVVEKTGTIRVIKGTTVLSKPLLDISASVSTGGEQGLLGLAFHPSYETNRRFYVNFTTVAGDTAINEYRTSATSPDRVEAGSGRRILTIDQPYANHNGGMIAFGKDGYLYIGMGDGGSAGDPSNRAQSLSSLLGKMLRIDVNGMAGGKAYRIPSSNPYVGRTGLDEIWSRGLRNPWRWSFDRSTGDLWIGDVGQAKWEEVDRSLRTASGAGRGVNYGWRVMEGRHCYLPATGCSTTGKVLPLVEYAHGSGRCAVTGGYVYRGTAHPDMVGGYFYGDYCTGEIFAVSAGAASPAAGTRLLDTSLQISGFGQDDAGNLYVLGLGGQVYRLRDG